MTGHHFKVVEEAHNLFQRMLHACSMDESSAMNAAIITAEYLAEESDHEFWSAVKEHLHENEDMILYHITSQS